MICFLVLNIVYNLLTWLLKIGVQAIIVAGRFLLVIVRQLRNRISSPGLLLDDVFFLFDNLRFEDFVLIPWIPWIGCFLITMNGCWYDGLILGIYYCWLLHSHCYCWPVMLPIWYQVIDLRLLFVLWICSTLFWIQWRSLWIQFALSVVLVRWWYLIHLLYS